MGNLLCKTDELARIEQEREEGQALLRRMVVSSEEVDWAAVIAKANELHRKEQHYLQSKNKRQRRLLERLQRRALHKRRRHDSIGSFSVNMLTFRSPEEKTSATSISNTSRDDHSYDGSHSGYGSGLSADGFGLNRSLDEGMEPIDEEYEQVYSVP